MTATAYSIHSPQQFLSNKSTCSLNNNNKNSNYILRDQVSFHLATRTIPVPALGVRRRLLQMSEPKLQSLIQDKEYDVNTKNKDDNEMKDISIMEKHLLTDEATKHDDELVICYLKRIGFSQEEITSFIEKTDKHHHPTMQNLQRLLSAHLLHVPFENMDQHTHPPGIIANDNDNSNDNNDRKKSFSVPEIKRKKQLPSLDVKRSLNKIIRQNRGGFCYEVNLSFCWLLRRLGYKARLAVADVSCKQDIPAHVVILVDGLKYDDDYDNNNLNQNDNNHNIPVLVDVGFGCPGVCDVILPLNYGRIYSDLQGDSFRFVKAQSHFPLHEGRFNTVLYRTRVNADLSLPNKGEEPMYRFHSEDDLEDDATEFRRGLEYVLTKSPTFNEKRLCVISTERGHITLGSDYVKWVEKWEVVKQKNFMDEEGWRKALLDYFGVQLIANE